LSYWKTAAAAEQVKRLVQPLISFISHPFGPADLTDDPDYLELRERVLRKHGVWAPPGSSYRIGEASELERPSNTASGRGNHE
jgi:hypothetical protein